MLYITVDSTENGAHGYIECNYATKSPHYALVPPSIQIPPSFPYVDIDVKNGIVTKMVARTVPYIPEPEPQPEPEPEPQPTLDDRVATLESDNNLLKQQLKAASDQNEFLEDCIAEMAGIVYA